MSRTGCMIGIIISDFPYRKKGSLSETSLFLTFNYSPIFKTSISKTSHEFGGMGPTPRLP